MPRHSKNSNTQTYIGYHEKKKNATGSQSLIYGSDSVKPFDCCTLCLHHVSTPMCCEQGHLFCKECVLKYLLTKKKEYEEQLQAYEEQMQELQEEEEAKVKTAQGSICDSIEKQQSVNASEQKDLYKASTETKEEKDFRQMKETVEKLSRKYDDRTEEEKSLKMNFWLPENTPEAKASVKMPSKEILCPSGSHAISLKKLIPLHFSEIEGKDGNVFACPACMKQFTYQQVIAVKECGHVLCGECFKKFVGSSKQCYVCQHPVLKKKDFLQLESGGTGFSSHNKVDVKVYKPNENYACLLPSA